MVGQLLTITLSHLFSEGLEVFHSQDYAAQSTHLLQRLSPSVFVEKRVELTGRVFHW